MAVDLLRTPYIYFPVNMRDAPTVTLLEEGALTSGSSGEWAWFQSGTWQYGSFTAASISEKGYAAHKSSIAGGGDGKAYYMHINWTATAEL